MKAWTPSSPLFPTHRAVWESKNATRIFFPKENGTARPEGTSSHNNTRRNAPSRKTRGRFWTMATSKKPLDHERYTLQFRGPSTLLQPSSSELDQQGRVGAWAFADEANGQVLREVVPTSCEEAHAPFTGGVTDRLVHGSRSRSCRVGKQERNEDISSASRPQRSRQQGASLILTIAAENTIREISLFRGWCSWTFGDPRSPILHAGTIDTKNKKRTGPNKKQRAISAFVNYTIAE